jgi:AAHS family 4-hydroxybenzoate transporter-like MFS transporter
LPESLDYLLRQGNRAADVCRILSKLGPQIPENEIRKLNAWRDPERGFEVSRLFRNGRAPRTLLLWAIFFMNLVALYFYNTWLPTLLSDAGISAANIVKITAAGQIGGLAGALIIARLLVSQPPFAVIASGSLFVAAGFLSMFRAGTSQGALLAGNFFLGLFLLGSQYGLNAMSAQLYPSNIRATAVGWALGVGRLGGILGPSIAGMLIALRWAPWHLFLFAAIPAVLSSAGACGMHRLLREPSLPGSIPPG